MSSPKAIKALTAHLAAIPFSCVLAEESSADINFHFKVGFMPFSGEHCELQTKLSEPVVISEQDKCHNFPPFSSFGYGWIWHGTWLESKYQYGDCDIDVWIDKDCEGKSLGGARHVGCGELLILSNRQANSHVDDNKISLDQSYGICAHNMADPHTKHLAKGRSVKIKCKPWPKGQQPSEGSDHETTPVLWSTTFLKRAAEATAAVSFEDGTVLPSDAFESEDRTFTSRHPVETGSSSTITRSGTTSTLHNPTHVVTQFAPTGTGLQTVVEDFGTTETVSVDTETAL